MRLPPDSRVVRALLCVAMLFSAPICWCRVAARSPTSRGATHSCCEKPARSAPSTPCDHKGCACDCSRASAVLERLSRVETIERSSELFILPRTEPIHVAITNVAGRSFGNAPEVVPRQTKRLLVERCALLL